MSTDWQDVVALHPQGEIVMEHPGRKIRGPIKDVQVCSDGVVLLRPKWLTEEVFDRYGKVHGPRRRIVNHCIEFDGDYVRFTVEPSLNGDVIVFDGDVAGIGSRRKVSGQIGIAPVELNGELNQIKDLVLDGEGCEVAPFGLTVPELVRVDPVQLIQHFPDARGDVVNDFPMTWVDMLLQGARAYHGDESFPEGYGDQCQQEFRIAFALKIEPTLVAQAASDDKMMSRFVADALHRLAADWGGVTVEWSGWVDETYGRHVVVISNLLQSFADGLPMSECRVLGFNHPDQLGEAERDWSASPRLLARFLEHEIRSRLNAEQVMGHLVVRGHMCPRLG